VNTKYPENWPQFYTATIEGWKNLLEKDHYKMVIINSLQFLVKNKQVRISAFVIMSNHILYGRQSMAMTLRNTNIF